MRRRLLTSTALIALVAVVVLGVPLGIVERHRVRAEAASQLEREADRVAAATDDTLERGEPLDRRALARLVRKGHEVTIRAQGRPLVALGRRLGDRQTIAERSALAPNAIVTARAPSEEVDERVWARWLLIALLSLGGVLAAIALGLVQNRRLAQPLERLARTSRKLGAGDFSARAGRFAIPEIDAVAAALDASALNIARLVGREREFTANVSHQLRTPLTALHLRLEELRQLDDPALIRIEADRAIAEADRLERTITDLLSAARSELAQGAGDPLDLHALIESHTSTWRPLFERAGRRLEIGLSHAPRAHASAGAVGQALDVLLDNALQHGAGRVVLRVREHEGRPTITVEDAGDGIAPGHEAVIFERGHSPRGSSGVGLHLARSLINSAGGQLELRSPRPPAFEIRLRPSRA